MAGVPTDHVITDELEELLAGGVGRQRALVRRICQRWPDVPALPERFSLSSAAAMIEDNFDRARDPERISAFAWKLAALLAADIYAVESMGKRPATAHDLLHFWRRVDPYFLEL